MPENISQSHIILHFCSPSAFHCPRSSPSFLSIKCYAGAAASTREWAKLPSDQCQHRSSRQTQVLGLAPTSAAPCISTSHCSERTNSTKSHIHHSCCSAHRLRAAVALLATLHHAVAAGSRLPVGKPGQARPVEQAVPCVQLEEALKVFNAAAAKGFCPTDTSKTKDYPRLCRCQHIHGRWV